MNEIEKETAETKSERGSPIRLLDMLILYLLHDGVVLVSNSDSEFYNALRCTFCSQQHLIDSNSIFECTRCGCQHFEKVEV